ncbi:MAG: hypothetical protein ACRENX_05580 [Candidatus Dormibacteria bacterium]
MKDSSDPQESQTGSALEDRATDGPTLPRNAASWATKVDRLQVQQREGMRGTNVAGRRLTSPIQGFGKMWQKTYSTNLGSTASPKEVIATWKAHFPEFWPNGNRFAGALAGISPGDLALLDLSMGGVKLTTGVFVLYADAESFTMVTPEGHMFAGWISFSSEDIGAGTIARAEVLMRANDPLYEVGLTFGGQRKEDRFWSQTLTNLAQKFGVQNPVVATKSVCLDRKRQWRNARNTWQNAMIRSVFQTLIHPFGGNRRQPGGGKISPHE